MGAVGVRLPPPPACGCRGCPSALARTPLCFNVSPTRRLPLQCLLQRRLFWRWLPRAWRLQHVPLVVPGHAEQRRRCPKGRRPKKRKKSVSPETLKMLHSLFFFFYYHFWVQKFQDSKSGAGGGGRKMACGSSAAPAKQRSVVEACMLKPCVAL